MLSVSICGYFFVVRFELTVKDLSELSAEAAPFITGLRALSRKRVFVKAVCKLAIIVERCSSYACAEFCVKRTVLEFSKLIRLDYRAASEFHSDR